MSECTRACDHLDRRDFLGRTTAALAIIMTGFAATPREAAALWFAEGKPLRAAGGELTYPIPAADGATIDRENEVILVRWQNAVYAFNLSCPHQNTALKWLDTDMRFQCPKHKSKYQPDGTFISGRATRNLDRFALRKDGGNVVVNIEELFASDKQAQLWQAASVAA